MWFMSPKNISIPAAEQALPGRDQPLIVSETHFVSSNRIKPPFPDGMETALFGMGCFWGAERLFWLADGIYATAVGYSAGHTANPRYEEVCSGQTGHNEVVLVIFDPAIITYGAVLRLFWEGHNPTQGMRQGNDAGTQYRSGIYVYSGEQRQAAAESMQAYAAVLAERGHDAITTEILDVGPFYYAEDYHQQYLAKNPGGYCGLGGTGVACPVGVEA
ncbi:MAG: peptide-methionine (S)-S-oxide reductase MsrA [Alphaproteobacteria bacterium]